MHDRFPQDFSAAALAPLLPLCALCASVVSPARAGPTALVDVRSLDSTIRVRLSYASERNAFHRRLYAGNVALLREPVARRLAGVQARLRKQGLGLEIWDAYRPTSAQVAMWKA